MPDSKDRTRHEQLARELERHARAYYAQDAPTISDAEYDGLFRDLLSLEARSPELVTPHSPSQRVGAQAREGFTKYKRPVRMYSLDNAYSEAELREFDERVVNGLGH
ncbi:MAG TPA: hypothetical protein VFX59_01665, partial [Polyangiales bacterium]|nr:hypothetical protein [Polyangiales bacterium]